MNGNGYKIYKIYFEYPLFYHVSDMSNLEINAHIKGKLRSKKKLSSNERAQKMHK